MANKIITGIFSAIITALSLMAAGFIIKGVMIHGPVGYVFSFLILPIFNLAGVFLSVSASRAYSGNIGKLYVICAIINFVIMVSGIIGLVYTYNMVASGT